MNSANKIYGNHGPFLRCIFMIIASVYYLLSLILGKKQNNIIVLCYHGVTEKQRDLFRCQMKQIYSRCIKFETLPAKSFGISTLPYIVLTFDDAFENLLLNVIVTLEEFKIPAIIFPVISNLGEKPRWAISSNHPEADQITMSADQLVMVGKNPLISMGSHTCTHPDLSAVDHEIARKEMKDSKLELEKILGYDIQDLSLPHGAYNNDVLSIAYEVGYKRIYTLDPCPVQFGPPLKKIGRFSMSPGVWKIEFILTCAGAYSWLLYFKKIIHSAKQIITLHGAR